MQDVYFSTAMDIRQPNLDPKDSHGPESKSKEISEGGIYLVFHVGWETQ